MCCSHFFLFPIFSQFSKILDDFSEIPNPCPYTVHVLNPGRFSNASFYEIFLYFFKPWTIFIKFLYFPSKLQVIFPPFFLLDLEFPTSFYPACNSLSKFSIFSQVLFQIFPCLPVWWHPVSLIQSSLRVTSPTRCDKVFQSIESSAPDPSFPGGTIHGSRTSLVCFRTTWTIVG